MAPHNLSCLHFFVDPTGSIFSSQISSGRNKIKHPHGNSISWLKPSCLLKQLNGRTQRIQVEIGGSLLWSITTMPVQSMQEESCRSQVSGWEVMPPLSVGLIPVVGLMPLPCPRWVPLLGGIFVLDPLDLHTLTSNSVF